MAPRSQAEDTPPPDDLADLERLAWHRLFIALDEVRSAAAVLGLDVDALGTLYAPRALRTDAFLERRRRHREQDAVLDRWIEQLSQPLTEMFPAESRAAA